MRLPEKVPARRPLRDRREVLQTITSQSQAHLMGLPTELRVEIFWHVIHPDAMRVVFFSCCDYHDWNSNVLYDQDMWYSESWTEFETCVRHREKLLGVCTTFRAEVQTFLMKKWEVQLCVTHRPSIAGGPDRSDRIEVLRGPLDTEWDVLDMPSSSWDRPSMLHTIARSITRINLRLEIWAIWDIDEWELQLRHWEFLDTCQYLMHLLQSVETPKHLRVVLEMHARTTADAIRLEQRLPMLLSRFETLRDEVDLEIEVDFRTYGKNIGLQLDDSHASYMENLQSPSRSRHFEPRKRRLDEKWYKLRAWTEDNFGYGIGANAFESNFAVLAANGGKEEELQENLRVAWHAQHTGNAELFARAKDMITDMWLDHNKRALKAIADI